MDKIELMGLIIIIIIVSIIPHAESMYSIPPTNAYSCAKFSNGTTVCAKNWHDTLKLPSSISSFNVTNAWILEPAYYSTWHDASLTSAFVNNDSSISNDPRLYIFRNAITDVRYLALSNSTWHKTPNSPINPPLGKGSCVAYDSNDSLYLTNGGNTKWMKYTISSSNYLNETNQMTTATGLGAKCAWIDGFYLVYSGGGVSNLMRSNGGTWITALGLPNIDPAGGTENTNERKFYQGIFSIADKVAQYPIPNKFDWGYIQNTAGTMSTVGAGSGNIRINFTLTIPTASTIDWEIPSNTGSATSLGLGAVTVTENGTEGNPHKHYNINFTIPYSTSGAVSGQSIGTTQIQVQFVTANQTTFTNTVVASVSGTGTPTLNMSPAINTTGLGTHSYYMATHHILGLISRMEVEQTPSLQVSRATLMSGASSWYDRSNDTMFFSQGSEQNKLFFLYPMTPSFNGFTRLYQVDAPLLPFNPYQDNSGNNIFTAKINGTKYLYVVDTAEGGQVYYTKFSNLQFHRIDLFG